jgi:hypothetical protein
LSLGRGWRRIWRRWRGCRWRSCRGLRLLRWLRRASSEPEHQQHGHEPGVHLSPLPEVGRRPYRPMSITIAGTACRAAADSTADRTDPRADCRAAPGIRANRSEYCSSGRTPRGSAEWPRRYRLARRRPITWRRWIILRILKRCGRRYCRKHKSAQQEITCRTISAPHGAPSLDNVTAAEGKRQWPAAAVPVPGRASPILA